MSSAKGYQACQGLEHRTSSERLRGGPVQPGEEKARGRSCLLSRTAWLEDMEKVKIFAFLTVMG